MLGGEADAVNRLDATVTSAGPETLVQVLFLDRVGTKYFKLFNSSGCCLFMYIICCCS